VAARPAPQGSQPHTLKPDPGQWRSGSIYPVLVDALYAGVTRGSRCARNGNLGRSVITTARVARPTHGLEGALRDPLCP
jgi:hypothetical protein